MHPHVAEAKFSLNIRSIVCVYERINKLVHIYENIRILHQFLSLQYLMTSFTSAEGSHILMQQVSVKSAQLPHHQVHVLHNNEALIIIHHHSAAVLGPHHLMVVQDK